MITINPEEMLNEATSFNKKITEGFSNLADVGEIGSGVTPHETIYEEDKLKLYHYKSDSNLTTNSVPMLLPPPGLFSTMTCWPKRSLKVWAMMRAKTSVVPAGG